jgi:hypothetical protein
LPPIIDQQTALAEISPEDIYRIEALESYSYLAIYGEEAMNGLILITTKYGDEADAPVVIQPGLIKYSFKGFYKAREFYSPKYDLKKTVSLSDNRKTVFWSPDIVTGADGKISFDYLNAAEKGNYRVVIEGIDANGKLGRQVFSYKVE